MSITNLHIFSKNTDAFASQRGYNYQTLKKSAENSPEEKKAAEAPAPTSGPRYQVVEAPLAAPLRSGDHLRQSGSISAPLIHIAF